MVSNLIGDTYLPIVDSGFYLVLNDQLKRIYTLSTDCNPFCLVQLTHTLFHRFDPEHKNNHSPATFLPFGAGPRNCVAMRFALVEIKLVLVNLLKNYQIVTCPETVVKFLFAIEPYD